MFLGCNGIVIKSHGSSNDQSILASIKQAISIYDNKILDEISSKMNERINIEWKF